MKRLILALMLALGASYVCAQQDNDGDDKNAPQAQTMNADSATLALDGDASSEWRGWGRGGWGGWGRGGWGGWGRGWGGWGGGWGGWGGWGGFGGWGGYWPTYSYVWPSYGFGWY